MTRLFTIGTIFGKDLRIHWSWPLLPIGVAGYSFAVNPWWDAAFHLGLLAAIYLIVLVHEGIQFLAARRLGLGTRDVTLYPLWGVSRAARLSDRPRQEKFIGMAGIAFLAVVSAAIACSIVLSGKRVLWPNPQTAPTVDAFFVCLFWASTLLVALHALPLLPLDCGRLIRALLTNRTTRIRATEIAAGMSTAGAGIMLFTAIVWLKSPFLAAIAVLVYLSAQEDLDTTRQFEKMRVDTSRDRRSPTLLVPIEEIITPKCQPAEPHFSGFTWNEQARLWIEWQDGQPVAANAILGDGRP